jgi:hypothetical protein
LAVYTVGDAIWAVVLFVVLLVFLGVGIWLLIQLFRNKNFLPEHRGLRIVVKVLLLVFTLFLPVLGLPALLVIWFFTRSRGDEPPDADGAQPGALTPSVVEPAHGRPVPFPPPSVPEDT